MHPLSASLTHATTLAVYYRIFTAAYPLQCGSVMKDYRCLLPPALWHGNKGVPPPTTPYTTAVYNKILTVHHPVQCGSVLHDTLCQLPPRVWQCLQGVPLPPTLCIPLPPTP